MPRGVVLALSLVGLSTTVRAAPPDESPEQDVPSEPTISLEEARLMIARDLHVRGEQCFGEGDYRGAIEAWTQVLVLMPDKQADLRVPLAHAHRRAYAADEELEHLHAARALFTEQLAGLEVEDATRADIEAELAEIEAELAALDEAKAQAQAQREEAIRQEQIRLDQRALAEAEVEHQRAIQKVYYGVGGSLVGLGIGSLAAMTGFLVGGAKLDREGSATANMIGVQEGYYEELLLEGQVYNRTALATGIVGGVLTLTGGALLTLAAVRHKRVLGRKEQVTVYPTFGGVSVRF